MKPEITKTVRVLDYQGYSDLVPEWVVFGSEDLKDHIITFHGSLWDELGRPAQLTVTIEMGDQLNEEEPDANTN